MLLNFGDFSRYVKTEKDLKLGNLNLFQHDFVFIFSNIYSCWSRCYLNQKLIIVDQILTKPMDIVGKLDNTVLTVFALIFIIFSSLSTNLILIMSLRKIA